MRRRCALGAAIVALAACDGGRTRDVDSPASAVPESTKTVASIDETFVTASDTMDNVDSPAVYHSGTTHWVMASAKSTDVVLVYDAANGQLVRRVGGSGEGVGQLKRPNGLAVINSFLFVVERDNKRVQVFTLPEFKPLGTFGTPELRKPYGIAWYPNADGSWNVFITDNYETPDEGIPPDGELGERVKQYKVSIGGGQFSAQLVKVFGDTTAAGALRTVESIAVDAAKGRLLIAEETEVDSHIKVYDLDGRFTGEIVGRGFFPQQAEGIAVWSCPDSTGYVVATDQGLSTNTFHVFDRATLSHLGSWSGRQTRLTDGIALTQTSFGPFPSGALYASNLDAGLTAQSWEAIAAALGLRSTC